MSDVGIFRHQGRSSLKYSGSRPCDRFSEYDAAELRGDSPSDLASRCSALPLTKGLHAQRSFSAEDVYVLKDLEGGQLLLDRITAFKHG